MDHTASFLFDPDRDGHSAPPRLGEVFSTAFGNRRYRGVLLAGFLCACISLVMIGRGILQSYHADTDQALHSVAADEFRIMGSVEQLLDELKNHSLWELPADRSIPPIIFANFPADLNLLDVETRKQAFLHALLPSVLLVEAEVRKERETLERILSTYEEPGQVTFSEEDPEWQARLTASEIEFIEHLAAKYRSGKASDLLARVDTLPVSLIMAQAALESSWGTSRFARKGNNIFGLWTWGENGLVPAKREEGKNHRIAVYDSILGSSRAYLLNINRLPAYRKLRQLRQQTRDPLLLADGLLLYSERREMYISELKTIIRHNQLDRYDGYTLAGELPAGSVNNLKISKLML